MALRTVAIDGPRTLARHPFAAAVAYYPSPCEVDHPVAVPTLILLGELDDLAPAKACRDALARKGDGGATITLVVYPGAHHDFDRTNLSPDGMTLLGHRLQYNEAADHAAADEVRQFLRQALGK